MSSTFIMISNRLSKTAIKRRGGGVCTAVVRCRQSASAAAAAIPFHPTTTRTRTSSSSTITTVKTDRNDVTTTCFCFSKNEKRNIPVLFGSTTPLLQPLLSSSSSSSSQSLFSTLAVPDSTTTTASSSSFLDIENSTTTKTSKKMNDQNHKHNPQHHHQVDRKNKPTTTTTSSSWRTKQNNTVPLSKKKKKSTKTPKKKKNKKSSSNNHHTNKLPPNTNWILVTETPMLSNLNDICLTMERVVRIELERGIVDLDLVELDLAKKAAAAADVNGAAGAGDVMEKEEKEVTIALTKNGNKKDDNHDEKEEEEAEEETTSSYPDTDYNQQENALPIWDPNNNNNNNNSFPPHMILEARLFLSHAGRPSGWFLRFPNRSVVHAVLSHAKEGLEVAKLQSQQRMMRRMKQNHLRDNDNEMTNITTTTKTTQPIKCGGKIPSLEPFFAKPNPPTTPPLLLSQTTRMHLQNKLSQRQIMFRSYQYKFHQALEMKLNDSVIRVENCSFGTTVEDVELFFGGEYYDLFYDCGGGKKDNDDEEEEEEDTTGDKKKKKKKKSFAAVELWKDGYGTYDDDDDDNDENENENNSNDERRKNYNKNPPIFIVRFDSPSDARAAIREKMYHLLKGRKIRMMQYPCQILPEEEEEEEESL